MATMRKLLTENQWHSVARATTGGTHTVNVRILGLAFKTKTQKQALIAIG